MRVIAYLSGECDTIVCGIVEEPKRLAPTTDSARTLYLKSGNRCALPGCAKPLIGTDGILIGQIAHIHAASRGGPRFDPHMTNDERRAPENLVLLCAEDHIRIDTDTATWTAERLKDLKRRHESVYTSVVEDLRRTIRDVTADTHTIPPTNLLKVLGDQDLADDEVQQELECAKRFTEQLAALPVGARSLLSLITARGRDTSNRPYARNDVEISLALLKNLASGSPEELRDHLAILEDEGFAGLDEGFEGEPPVVAISTSTGGTEICYFSEIKRVANNEGAAIERALVDLDLSLLDG